MIQSTFLQELVQINFLPILVILFLTFFLNSNKSYERNLHKQIVPCVILLFMLVVLDNIDYYAYDKNIPGIMHRLSAMLGYDVRLFIQAYLTLMAVTRQTDKHHKIVFVPAILNVIIIAPCLFTDLVFYYRPDGSIGRGPLAFTPHIISLLYVLFLLALAFKCARLNRNEEAMLLVLCSTMSVVAVAVELAFQLRGILIGVIALDITFYYQYLHMEHFKHDTLTKVLNRESFYSDIEKFDEHITHVMNIDINNLKKINDTYGHNAGDKMIKIVAAVIGDTLPKEYKLYRIGGDEFAVLCFDQDNNSVDNHVKKIYEAIGKTKYRIAIGWAGREKYESFHDMYKRSDKYMYNAKKEIKERETEEDTLV